MTGFTRAGIELRRQPPATITVCEASNPLVIEEECAQQRYGCKGTPQPCPACGFRYCANHHKTHRTTTTYPVDAWRGTQRMIKRVMEAIPAANPYEGWHLGRNSANRPQTWKRGQLTIPGAPAVVQTCYAPTRTNVSKPCVMPATSCNGPCTTQTCCNHSYCPYHAPRHTNTILLPQAYWTEIQRRFNHSIERALATNGRHRIAAYPPRKVA
jgi:hypothetical protein